MAGNSVKNDTIVKGVFEDTNDRLSKKDACMLMALWMEMSPLAKIPQQPIKDSSECHEIKKVGVVVLDANGKLFASDFSHEFAHGVMSALFKHKQKLAGGIMFVSRKPCYDCTKHMIQAGIKTVYYFPVVPEVADKENLAVADHIFKVSHIAVKAFIPKVKKTRNHNSPFTKAVREDEIRKGKHKLEEFFGQDIIEENEYVLSDIQIPDTSTRNRRKEDFLEVMNWLARKAMGDVPSTLRIDYQANQYIPQTLKSILENQDFVRHAAAMTHILSHRTDDPETGVGAALISHTGDYLGFGYNGYQLDAEETDFPGLGDKNEPDKRKVKYSYIVHAETNALLFSNKSEFDPEKTLLVTSKVPCNHCTLHLRHVGIKYVIIPDDRAHRTAKSQTIGYGLFDDYCKDKHFNKYVLKESHPQGAIAARRQLQSDSDISADQPGAKVARSDGN